MGYELSAKRRNEIVRLLGQDGQVRVSDLAARFCVSTETIRKDLIELERKGLAKRSHGGAIKTQYSDLTEKTLSAKLDRQSDEKAEIASLAVSLIPDGATVMLDSGSTTLSIARALKTNKEGAGLTILTNSLKIAALLADTDFDLYMTGGKIRPASGAAIGEWTRDALDQVHIDIAFLGSDSFQGLSGPSAISYTETEFKHWVVEAADRVYAVADSSKFAVSGLFAYANWREISGLITDGGAPKDALGMLEESCPVMIAS